MFDKKRMRKCRQCKKGFVKWEVCSGYYSRYCKECYGRRWKKANW